MLSRFKTMTFAQLREAVERVDDKVRARCDLSVTHVRDVT
jgi:hypothetical protein